MEEKQTKRNHARIGSKYNPLHVLIKRLYPEAVIPTYAHETDAGLDLYAHSMHFDDDGNAVYGTGIAVAIPEGYVGLVFPRSSIAAKSLQLRNCVGVIDSGYRGEILAKFGTKYTFCIPQKPWKRFLYWLTGHIYSKGYNDCPINTAYFYGPKKDTYEVGDRIAQLILVRYPKVAFEEVDELPSSDRGEGGHGSTGN